MTKDPLKKTLCGVGGGTAQGSLACTAKDLVTTVHEIKDRLSTSGPGGAGGKWSTRLNQLLSLVDSYAVIGDVLIQHQPHTTALVWGAFRFIVKVRKPSS